jgi:hypothetical protein
MKSPTRMFACLALVAALAGCGLAETTAVTANQAAASAEQAKQAKEVEERLKKQVEDMQAQTKAAVDEAEKAIDQ